MLNAVIGDREVLGNRIFNQVAVVNDYVGGVNDTLVCNNYWMYPVYAGLRDPEMPNPSLVICPITYKHSALHEKLSIDLRQLTCRDMEGRVSWRMITPGQVFLHEYLLYQAMDGAALASVGGKIEDLAFGPVDVRRIDKNRARVNADSYAWFVTELAWTLRCGYYFDKPTREDAEDPL